LIFYKKKEDISGNLCPPGHYSHSPMKKNNTSILVQYLNNTNKKAACLRTATAARRICSFFIGVPLLLDTKK